MRKILIKSKRVENLFSNLIQKYTMQKSIILSEMLETQIMIDMKYLLKRAVVKKFYQYIQEFTKGIKN